jgi:hypothetical protein
VHVILLILRTEVSVLFLINDPKAICVVHETSIIIARGRKKCCGTDLRIKVIDGFDSILDIPKMYEALDLVPKNHRLLVVNSLEVCLLRELVCRRWITLGSKIVKNQCIDITTIRPDVSMSSKHSCALFWGGGVEGGENRARSERQITYSPHVINFREIPI